MRRRHAALAVPLVAGALAIVWWASPWSSTPDVISGARGAFGTQRVVHVLASVGVDPRGPAMRPINSGESIEVWYDASRGRTHVVLRRGTKVALDDVDRGLEPLDVSPAAQVPPALWEFVTGYRQALARHEYRAQGSGRVEGRRVLWLSAPTLDTVDVAIDPVSYQALWLRSFDSPLLIQLAVAKTQPYDRADFLTAKQRKGRHL